MTRLLPFAQVDLPGSVELDDGRYLVREPGAEPGAGQDVLAVKTLGTERARRRLRRARSAPVDPEPAATALSLARVTVIKARPFDSETDASEWLQEVCSDADLARRLTEELAATLNRALLAYAVGAGDPFVGDVHPRDAVAVRFGFGTGDEVAESRWTAAEELSEARREKLRAELLDGVGAQERVAAVLGGRDEIEPWQSLLLRARASAERGREAEAALILELAAGLMATKLRSGEAHQASEKASEAARAVHRGAAPDPELLRSALVSARQAARGSR